MSNDPRKKPKRADEPYQDGAPIPLPEVRELNPSAFGTWEELQKMDAERFAPTEISPVSELLPESQRRFLATLPDVKAADAAMPARRRPPAGAVDLEGVVELARRRNRVCPRPEAWQALYDMLVPPGKARGPLAPAPPVAKADWMRSSDLDKRLRLRDQLVWAAAHGKLEDIYEYLRKLPADGWHYMER